MNKFLKFSLVLAAGAVQAQQPLTSCPIGNPVLGTTSIPCDFEGECEYEPIYCTGYPGQSFGYQHNWKCIAGELTYLAVPHVPCPLPEEDYAGSENSPDPRNHVTCPPAEPTNGQACKAIPTTTDTRQVVGDEDFADCNYRPLFCTTGKPGMEVGGHMMLCECSCQSLTDEYEYLCSTQEVHCPDKDDEPIESPIMMPVEAPITDACDQSKCDVSDYIEEGQELVHVCGSNGIVYQNMGALTCANYCKEDNWIEVASKEVCKSRAPEINCDEAECTHPDVLAPVCGSDGVTYRNEGVLYCANYCKDESLTNHVFLKQHGPCGSDDDDKENTECNIDDCMHTEEYNQVCGSNGVTYQNPSTLLCQNYCEPDVVHIDGMGPCGLEPFGAADPNNDPVCPTTKPKTGDVCAYNMDCLYQPLRCDGMDHIEGYQQKCECQEGAASSLSFSCTDTSIDCPDMTADPLNDPSCPATVPSTEESCKDNGGKLCLYQPVFCDGAADDGDNIHGYQKRCSCSVEMGIMSTTGSYGSYQCEDIAVSCPGDEKCDIKDCFHSTECAPVCGSDGKTYQNQAALECQNYCDPENPKVQLENKGPCPSVGNNSADPLNDPFCPESLPKPGQACGENGEEDLTCSYQPKYCENNIISGYQKLCSCVGVDSMSLNYICGDIVVTCEEEDCNIENCIHTEECAPVCGTDGVTYDNESTLQCQNFCDPKNPTVFIDNKGPCQSIGINGDNFDPDPLNDPYCPNALPESGETCGGNGEENLECLYQPNYCGDGKISGYKKSCDCIDEMGHMNTAERVGSYQCSDVAVTCPEVATSRVTAAPSQTPALSQETAADPNNEFQCPNTKPSAGSDCSIDEDVSCYYQPIVCDGEVCAYNAECTCQTQQGDHIGPAYHCQPLGEKCPKFDDGSDDLPASQPSTVPVSSAPVSIPLLAPVSAYCPMEKPQEGALCALPEGSNSCRYTPQSCSGSLDITFRDICTCVNGMFACQEREKMTCHNSIPPTCPFLTPMGQEELCDIDESIVCGYDPAGCPGLADDGVFLTTCQCLNGEFFCLSKGSLDCGGYDRSVDSSANQSSTAGVLLITLCSVLLLMTQM